jgi:hypothetical protein
VRWGQQGRIFEGLTLDKHLYNHLTSRALCVTVWLSVWKSLQPGISSTQLKEIKMTNVITLPSFDSHAKTIIGGWKSFDKAQDRLSSVVCTTMQKFVDTWLVQVGKDEKAVKAMGKAINP